MEGDGGEAGRRGVVARAAAACEASPVMRNVFFLLLLCSSCSNTPVVDEPHDSGNTKPVPEAGSDGNDSGSGGAPGAGGATTTLDGSPPSGGCGDKAPAKCPSPAPSFSKEVFPIFEAKCNNCHVGDPGPWAFGEYGHIRDWRLNILIDVEGCTMPPLDAGATLSADERRAVLGWLVCEAPDN